MINIFLFSGIVVRGNPSVARGDTIRIECNVTGATDMTFDVDWFKDGNRINAQERQISISKDRSIAKKTLNSVLEIRNSKMEDSGTYVCRTSERLVGSQRIQIQNGKNDLYHRIGGSRTRPLQSPNAV